MKETARLAVGGHRLCRRLYRPLYCVHLVVFRGDLDQLPTGLFEKAEMSDQVDEVVGTEEAADQYVKRGAALHLRRIHRLPLGEALGRRTPRIPVYESLGGGDTWTSAGLEGMDVLSLAMDPTNPTVVYAGTYVQGVWVTNDGGATWSSMNEGLNVHTVLSLAVDPSGSVIYAGTDGGGVSAWSTE